MSVVDEFAEAFLLHGAFLLNQTIQPNSLASAFAGGAGGRFDELSLLPRIRPEAVPVPYSGITCIVAVPGTVIGAGFGAGGGAGAAAWAGAGCGLGGVGAGCGGGTAFA